MDAHLTESHLIEIMGFITDWGLTLLGAILVLVAGWVGGNWVSQRVRGIEKFDGTLSGFLAGFAKYGIFVISIVMVLGQFGIQTASLIAVLGAAGLAIGLSLQGTLGNVAAGVMLLILRPFNVGDFILFRGIGGTVKSLGLFVTELSTPDNVYISAPNGSIWNADIYNYSRNSERRQDFIVSISYTDDIAKTITVLQDLVDGESRILQTENRKPQIMVSKLGAYSVDLIVRVWSDSSVYWPLQWDMTRAIKETLDHNNITIPFPTQIHIHAPDSDQHREGNKKVA